MATMTQSEAIRALAELTNFRGDEGLREAVLASCDAADQAAADAAAPSSTTFGEPTFGEPVTLAAADPEPERAAL